MPFACCFLSAASGVLGFLQSLPDPPHGHAAVLKSCHRVNARQLVPNLHQPTHRPESGRQGVPAPVHWRKQLHRLLCLRHSNSVRFELKKIHLPSRETVVRGPEWDRSGSTPGGCQSQPRHCWKQAYCGQEMVFDEGPLYLAVRLERPLPSALESVPCSQFVDTPSEIGANREKLGVVPQAMERANPQPRHPIDHGKVKKSIFDRCLKSIQRVPPLTR